MGRGVSTARRSIAQIGFGLVLAFAPAAPAAAQNLSSSSIDGTVTDQTGGALPGVTVTVASAALQIAQLTTVTDTEGRYRVIDLPRGTYQVRFELQGFKALIRDGLVLNAGFAMRVDVALAVGGVEENVTVSAASPIVDVTSTRGGQTISTDLLTTALPGNKTVADLVSMTAGLTNTAGQDPGTLGQNARPRFNMYGIDSGNTNMTMMIDGFQIIANNPVPDVGATAEVDMKTFGNGADVKEIGVAMNMILKSGGNQFHGSFSASDSRQPSGNLTDALKARNLAVGSSIKYFDDFGGDVGGRIVLDKLWFFGSVRGRRSQISQPGLVLNPGPDGVYLTGDEPAAFPTLNATNLVGKLSVQMTPKYQLIVAASRDQNKSEADIQNQSYVFTPFNSTSVFDWEPRNAKMEVRGTPSSKLLFDVQFGRSGYDLNRDIQASCGLAPSTFDNATQLFGGCRFNQFGDSKYIMWIGDANVTAVPTSFLGGRHEFKIGYHLSVRHTGAIRPQSPAGDYQLTFDTIGGVPHQPLQIAVANAPADPRDWDNVYSAYFTDQWRVGGRLTFNLGMRYDRQHSFVPSQSQAAGIFAAAATFPDVEVGTWNYLAPRAAVAWDVAGNGKTVVKSTYGWFNTELDIASTFNRAAMYTTTYRWHDLNRNNVYDTGEVNLDINGADFLSTTSGSNTILNPDLELPHVQEITASLEREVRPGTAVRALYLLRRLGSDSASVNVLRPYSAFDIALNRRDPGPDGALGTADDGGFVTVYDFGPAFAGSRFVGNETINRPAGRNDYYQSVEGAFSQRLAQKWSLQVSYTATRYHRWIVSVPQSPNDDYAPLDTSWRWSSKVNGNYTFPHDVLVGAILDFVNGPLGQRTYVFRAADPLGGPPLRQQTTVTLRLDPFGAEHESLVPSLNLRIGKRFKRANNSLELSLDALNMANSSAIRAATYVSGPTYGTVTDILPPRQLRMGARFAF